MTSTFIEATCVDRRHSAAGRGRRRAPSSAQPATAVRSILVLWRMSTGSARTVSTAATGWSTSAPDRVGEAVARQTRSDRRVLDDHDELLDADRPDADRRRRAIAEHARPPSTGTGVIGPSTAVDHVHGATLDPQPPGVVEVADVAGAVPDRPSPSHRPGVVLGAPQVVVAVGDPRRATPGPRRSSPPERLERPSGIDDQHAPPRRTADQTPPPVVEPAASIVGEVDVGDRQALGHPVRRVQLARGASAATARSVAIGTGAPADSTRRSRRARAGRARRRRAHDVGQRRRGGEHDRGIDADAGAPSASASACRAW